MRIQVKNFMSSPVSTVTEKATAGEVRTIFQNRNIHAVPVVQEKTALPHNQQEIRGIITATNLENGIPDETPVTEIMTNRVQILHQDSSAKAAANMMLKKKVHHLVVMDDGDIVGMVSSMDFVRLVSEHHLD